MPRVSFACRLPAETIAAIKDEAAKHGCSQADAIVQAFRAPQRDPADVARAVEHLAAVTRQRERMADGGSEDAWRVAHIERMERGPILKPSAKKL